MTFPSVFVAYFGEKSVEFTLPVKLFGESLGHLAGQRVCLYCFLYAVHHWLSQIAKTKQIKFQQASFLQIESPTDPLLKEI